MAASTVTVWWPRGKHGLGSDAATAFLLLERNLCCCESTVLERWLDHTK